jgi:hypothetical protein
MDQALLRIIKENPATPLGQSILGAKLGITDADVRRTWILFGDPSMQLQMQPAPSAAGDSTHRLPKSARLENTRQ